MVKRTLLAGGTLLIDLDRHPTDEKPASMVVFNPHHA